MPKFILSGLIVTVVMASGAAQPAHGEQSFSCSFGRPACLGYSDKVVDQNSVCFNSYTCDFKGFICKSKFDDMVDEYNQLVRTAKSVSVEYDDLAAKTKRSGR